MAFLALYAWPVITSIFFARFAAATAVILAVLAGYLLLPAENVFGVNLPLLPRVDKVFMVSVAVIIIAMVMVPPNRGRASVGDAIQPGWLPRHKFILFLCATLFLGDVLTVLSNNTPAVIGGAVRPALRPYDAFSEILGSMVLISPLLLGRKFLATPESQLLLLKLLALAAGLYTLPALLETRISPQLSNMVYGFFPHSWVQHWRGGSWRPVVFLTHGLVLAIFFCCAVLAALVAYRSLPKGGGRAKYLMLGFWILMTLLLSSNLGSSAIALLLLPAVLFLNTRLLMMVAMAIAVVVLLYPTLRSANLVPTDRVVAIASSIDQTRAGSFAFRLRNEDMFLERVQQRPLFGWGGWGRARIYNESGHDISAADGTWIIAFATGGWVRYLSLFGLLCGPIILLFFKRRAYGLELPTAGLCVVLAANLIDLIPNTGQTPLTWLIVGALVGRLELGRRQVMDTGAEDRQADVARRVLYTRQTKRHDRAALVSRP